MRFLVAAIVLLACTSSCSGTVSRPALTVRVVDAVTQQPLAGIHVAYAVEIYVKHPRLLGIIPRPDPTIGYRLARKLHGTTDVKGEVAFEVSDLRLSRDEEAVGELVFVNVRVDMGHTRARMRLESFERRCHEGSPLCSGTPDDVDVAWGLAPDTEARGAVLHASREGHHGRLIIIGPVVVEPRPPPRPDEEVAVVDYISSRQKPEVMTVALERTLPSHGEETSNPK